MHSLNPVVTNDGKKILKGMIDVSSKSTAIGIPVLTINKSIVISTNEKICHEKGGGKVQILSLRTFITSFPCCGCANKTM